VNSKEIKSHCGEMETIASVVAYFNDKPYFIVVLFLTKPIPKGSFQPTITMLKHSCGIIIEAPANKVYNHSIFTKETVLRWLKSLVSNSKIKRNSYLITKAICNKSQFIGNSVQSTRIHCLQMKFLDL